MNDFVLLIGLRKPETL